ncbi:hypothetical protein NCCP2222_05590 [Sporosarcina sp. NCCP-2222]|uniref:sensor domain-containing diguanylate cyclase n=1 Tax=Sporosarcina sp. NCCP-2222 TaxID=2935073 RepID=UPI0020853F68|nr:diguanylate cyclase [Sporosarcina sp. NCCP-2222]GKV54612.1 hypothetical protein NCCP2222_05590 [Sporosarcina sp. NCCP-2222]
MNHQTILYEMKCGLFDLGANSMEGLPLEQTFEALQRLFSSHFGIDQADFLLYESNRFLPVCKHGKESTEVLLSNYIDSRELFNDKEFIVQITERGYGFADDYLIFRNKELDPLGAMLFRSTDLWHSFASTPLLHELKKAVSIFIDQVVSQHSLREKEKNYRKLFEVTELFNATMDSAVILDGVVKAVIQTFPSFQVDLLLSHEQKGKSFSYRLFDYLNERASAVDAFLSGELTIEHASDLARSILNVPIKGRQGIYGVLQIIAPEGTDFSAMQRSFVRMISNAAGNGLENASLYDQSHRLVEDLQLVNEVSRNLNSNLEMNDMLRFLKQQLIKAFQPMEIAFVFYKENGEYEISSVSSNFFFELGGADYLEFASTRLQGGAESIFEANIHLAVKEPVRFPFKSLVSIPITHQKEMTGFVLLLHKDEYFFSFDSFKLMRSLIGHSSLAISNSQLRDKLQELVDKDNLTKLFTRSYLDNYMKKAMENNESGVFILIDVDDFKMVNDTYGHAIGDQVLKQIADLILEAVKGRGIACRWGGEEIAIFLPSISKQKGIDFATELVSLVPKSTDPQVTISVGMNNWSLHQKTSFKELFQDTDQALYKAKNTGKNQLVVHGGFLTKV